MSESESQEVKEIEEIASESEIKEAPECDETVAVNDGIVSAEASETDAGYGVIESDAEAIVIESNVEAGAIESDANAKKEEDTKPVEQIRSSSLVEEIRIEIPASLDIPTTPTEDKGQEIVEELFESPVVLLELKTAENFQMEQTVEQISIDEDEDDDEEEPDEDEDEEDEEEDEGKLTQSDDEMEEDDQGPYEEEMEEEIEDDHVEDDSDSDCQVILDSADETNEIPDVKNASINQSKAARPLAKVVSSDEEDDDDDEDDDQEEDEEDDEEYDDNDLMNDVVNMSARKIEPLSHWKEPQSTSLKRYRSESPPKKIPILRKRLKRTQPSYRNRVMKRCIKQLLASNLKLRRSPFKNANKPSSSKMGVDQSGDSYHFQIEPVSTLDASIQKSIPTTPIKPCAPPKDEVKIVIDLDSSPEKTPQKPTTSQNPKAEQFEFAAIKPQEMLIQSVETVNVQLFEKPDEEIKRKADENLTVTTNEQNKENLHSNEKQNGTVAFNEIVGEKSVKDEEMEVSLVDDEEEDDEDTLISTNTEIVPKEPATVKAGNENENSQKRTTKTVEIVTLEDVADEDSEQKLDANNQNSSLRDLPNKNLNINKRRRSSSSYPTEDTKTPEDTTNKTCNDENQSIHPAKKLRAELESAFATHDSILSNYINTTRNESADSIQNHLSKLLVEIQTLNDKIKTKETEWNNMLHLKKMKEEIFVRLTRKKQTLEIMSTKVGEGFDESPQKLPKLMAPIQSAPQLSSTPLNTGAAGLPNISNVSAVTANETNTQMNTILVGSTASSIIQNRANMKSSELAKEKANVQKVHSILVSRNILPKPSTSPSTVPAASTQSPSTVMSSFFNQQQQLTNQSRIFSPQPSASAQAQISAQNSQHQPILNSYLKALASSTPTPTQAQLQEQFNEFLNGHHGQSLMNGGSGGNQPVMVGRQGVFKDVKSIIADFRQQHPENVPRRGRRVNKGDGHSILGKALKSDGNSRPSSNDSSSDGMPNMSNSKSDAMNTFYQEIFNQFAADRLGAGPPSMKPTGASSGHQTNSNESSRPIRNEQSYFQDMLNQIGKISGQPDRFENDASSLLMKPSPSGQTAPPPYPEVTLHPVSASNISTEQTGSLLHGILTKYSRSNDSPTAKQQQQQQQMPSSNYNSNFSPTLARLLTAPERITAVHNQKIPTHSYQMQSNAISGGGGGGGGASNMNLSKVVGSRNSEITITPVMNSTQIRPGKALVQHEFEKMKELIERHSMMDDEADDSVDRLVIDEGADAMGADELHHHHQQQQLQLQQQQQQQQQRLVANSIGQEINENDVPICQGCKKNEAQFVCAGCSNQWYCSRECQVTAWDDHSDVCTVAEKLRNYFRLKSRQVSDSTVNNGYYVIRGRRNRNRYHENFYYK